MPTTKLASQYWSTFENRKVHSNQVRLRLMLGMMVGLLILCVAATYFMWRPVLQSDQRVIHQQSVIKELDAALSSMKDAETGQRGYLLIGDESYLEPYHTAVDEVRQHMATLQARAMAGDISMPEITALTQQVNIKLGELDQTITLKKQNRTADAIDMMRNGQGKRAMDEIRKLGRELSEQENGELLKLRARADQARVTYGTIFLLIAALGILGSLWAYQRISSEMERRAKAAMELRLEKHLMAVTLGSIGDAVIVTDADANVAFMNSVAEGLTGWKLAEASGRSLAAVFRIINEQSRLTVESPVSKVLREGMVVGLANHTVLISKDGHEVPIDDSGAPIRDEEGHVYGVVLIFRDFTEQKETQRSIIKAKEAADAANRAKDQFLATLSHELRTPLTPVLATLSIWEGSADVPTDMIADIQMLRRNVDLEVRLIDDLLDLTKISKGKLPLNMETVDVHELLNSVVGIVQSDVNVKHLKLRINLDSKRHFVRADSARLQQIMWNVLKNAVKFTDDGGQISVQTIDGADGELEMIFRDTGIGMSPDTLGRLFRPFEQGTGVAQHRYGGLGLGMALSKALVEAHGGKIRAESEGVGKGATFVVTLPVAEPAAQTGGEKPARPGLHAGGNSLRILLVEDHIDTARAMARILTGFGHHVDVAHTVSAGLEMARADAFDLLLSDIGLPDGTGIELVKRIHAEKPLRAVALTGFGMEDDVTRCKEAGFSAHLTKPVNLRSLQMVIEEVMATNPG